MTKTNKLLLVSALSILLVESAFAQSSRFPPIAYPNASGNFSSPGVVDSFVNGSGKAIPISSTNPLPVSGSFSATLAGFTPNGAFATLTSTAASSASTALPTGTVVDLVNTGTSAVSCTPATGAATGVISNLQVAPGGGHTPFVVGTFDHVACRNQAGDAASNVVVLEGGSGLANTSGGGGGGGGGATNITQVGGVNVPTGGGLQSGALPVDDSTSSQLHADLTSAITAGTNIIGKVGIDQTTPGTTNGVQINAGTAAIGSVFGPTAVGSANANPPIVMGGTATGAAGANVQGVSVVATSVAPVTATNTAVVVDLRPDSPGIITLGPATPANSVPTVGAGFTYGNMTTATTTTFKSGAGVLHTVTINSLGTGASTISMFDNTAGSGTSIGVLNSLTTGQGTYTFDVAFATGLTLVTTGTVAPNVTVSYR